MRCAMLGFHIEATPIRIEGVRMWCVQYWDDEEYIEIEGSRTEHLKDAMEHRKRLQGKASVVENGAYWKPSRYRVRPVEPESQPPLPW